VGISGPERRALGVVAVLLTLGAGARYLHSPPPAAELHHSASESPTADALPAGRTAEEVARAKRRSLPLAEGERIDPSTADADELQRLPRVGPALAARIIEHRGAHGPYRTLGDLDAVPGIGPALLERLAPLVALPPGPRGVGGGDAAASSRVRINAATAEELRALPGIGPALAGRILDRRAAHGPIRNGDDLQEVPGIGPRLRERLVPHLDFSP
jgi:competence ComEA-like helix-hairpin-helix protein